jgi:hypothetical protein
VPPHPAPPITWMRVGVLMNLVKCVVAVQASRDKSANAKVAALHLTAEDRKACAKAILAWYKQQAEKAAGKKT